jgi:predicted phage tail protein
MTKSELRQLITDAHATGNVLTISKTLTTDTADAVLSATGHNHTGDIIVVDDTDRCAVLRSRGPGNGFILLGLLDDRSN